MKLLDRWVLRRFVTAYAAFSASVLLVYAVTDLLNHLNVFMRDDRPLWISLRDYYGAIVPEIYYVLAPFVTLVAAMWVVFELRRSNEMVPLMAAGVAPTRVALPLFGACAVLAVGTFYDREEVIPRFAVQRRTASKLGRLALIPTPVPDKTGGVLMGRGYLPESRSLSEARYTVLDAEGREAVSAIASLATPLESGGWLFHNGLIIRVERDAAGVERDRVEPIPASGTLVRTDVRPLDIESASVDTVPYLTSAQMREQIARVPGMRHLEVQYAKRYSYPVSSLVLLLLGLPFVLRGDKSAAAVGMLACIGICALYFLAAAFCEDWGSRPGGLPPWVAAWLPNALFGTVGLIALLRSTRP